MIKSVLVSAAVGLVLPAFALVLAAETTVVTDRNQEESATGRFKFKNVPSPCKNDAAAAAKFDIVDGRKDPNAAGVEKLHDGQVPAGEDEPSASFFFGQGTDGGRIRIDLGNVIDIKQVNTYSWHGNTRGPQVYTLYASDGKPADFSAEPRRGVDPEKCGWKRIADVDTRPKEKGIGGQYGVSISGSKGTIGAYRYLLLDIFRTENDDTFGNTFFSEIDVVDRNGPAPQPVDAAALHEIQDTVEIDGGKYKALIDTSETPELTEWSRKELGPMLREWYPRLVKMLPSEGYEVPRKFSIVFSKGMKGVASTSGTRIKCAGKWVGENLKGEALGAIFHEVVHVVQQYGGAPRGSVKPPVWLTEGMTDYLRWFLYEPQTHGAEITKQNIAGARYDGGYRVTANFINWVCKKYGADFLTKLNAAIREGRYNEEFWKTLTGCTVQELGDNWKKDAAKNLEARLP
jgi:hypothetical protein